MTITLTTPLEKRLQKLAKAAGRTPEQMLKLVAEYGFPAIEGYLEKAGRGIAQADHGELLTTEQVFSSIEKRRGNVLPARSRRLEWTPQALDDLGEIGEGSNLGLELDY